MNIQGCPVVTSNFSLRYCRFGELGIELQKFSAFPACYPTGKTSGTCGECVISHISVLLSHCKVTKYPKQSQGGGGVLLTPISFTHVQDDILLSISSTSRLPLAEYPQALCPFQIAYYGFHRQF